MTKKQKVPYPNSTVIHGRKILRLIASLGDNHYYEVKCGICEKTYAINGASIQKKTACKFCTTKRYGKQTYKKIQEQNAYDRRRSHQH